MVTRKSTPKATVVDAPEAERSAMHRMFDMLQGSEDLAAPTLSITRTMSALLVSLTAGGSLAYFGMQCVQVMMIATAIGTASAFLAFMVGFIASALLFIGVFVLTGKVQTYILTGGIDRTYETTKMFATEKFASVKSWFKTRGNKEIDRVRESSSAAATYETLRNAKPVRGFKHA